MKANPTSEVFALLRIIDRCIIMSSICTSDPIATLQAIREECKKVAKIEEDLGIEPRRYRVRVDIEPCAVIQDLLENPNAD